MFLIYLGLASFGIIIAVYFGLKLSEPITHPIMFLLFWILYFITILSVLNVITSGAFFIVLRYKKGPPGIPGEQGPKGEKGDSGNCEETCKEDLCQKIILDKMTSEFNRLMTEVNRKEPELPLSINNGFVKETVKRICHSPQFKEVSRIKHPSQILEYLAEIWKVWLKLLFDADPSSEKSRFKTWLETHGADNEWEAITQDKPNPFDEIKKYDVYYWGLSSQFKPIKIDHCLTTKGEDEKINNAKIQAIESNFYQWVYNDRKTGSNSDIEIWRGKPIKYQGKTYYPLGDVGLRYYGGDKAKRSFKEVGTESRGMTSTDVSDTNGPAYTTVLVDGSSPYVEVPQHYDMHWNDRGSGGRYDTAFWMPKDFTKNGRNFKCFGGIAGYKTYKNPFEVYGRGDNHPIRCIDESCLEKIPQRSSRIWKDKGSGASLDGSVWTNSHPNFKSYRVVYFPYRTQGDMKRDFYKIKEECMRDSQIENDAEEYVEEKISYGWHGTPKRPTKYSIFNFLDLVIESKVVNSNTGETYYLAHTGAQTPNSYFVKPFNKQTETYSNCLKVRGGISYTNGTCNINDDNEIWEIDFSVFDPNVFFLKSKSRGTYLYLEKSANGIYYPRNKTVSSEIRNDHNKSKKYQWYFEDN
jgi:hypothetical protein